MSNVCTLTITADEVNDRIYLDVVYDKDDMQIDLEKATQAQKTMKIVHLFADMLLAGQIPHMFFEAIFAIRQAVEGENEN